MNNGEDPPPAEHESRVTATTDLVGEWPKAQMFNLPHRTGAMRSIFCVLREPKTLASTEL